MLVAELGESSVGKQEADRRVLRRSQTKPSASVSGDGLIDAAALVWVSGESER